MTTITRQPAAAPGPANQPICGAHGLTKVYDTDAGRVVAVDNVSVGIAPGSLTAIMGPSGSGKSTLLHLLAGLDRATAGTAFVGPHVFARMSESQITKVRRDHLGFVFQQFNLLPTLNAEQNIRLPLELAGRKADEEYFRFVVDSLGIADRLTHRPSQLSGGQQQRVAIARALITRPHVVFADEPTGSLDSKAGHALLGYLQRAARDHGQTIIMVTHDPLAVAYASRALILLDGRIVDDIAFPSAQQVMARMAELT